MQSDFYAKVLCIHCPTIVYRPTHDVSLENDLEDALEDIRMAVDVA